jgi:hypothetical protein
MTSNADNGFLTIKERYLRCKLRINEEKEKTAKDIQVAEKPLVVGNRRIVMKKNTPPNTR